MATKRTVIYSLSDPRSGDIRYIGKTAQTLPSRLSAHIKSAKTGCKTRRSRWLRSLLMLELKPVMEVIEVCGDDWQARERHWIMTLRSQGVALTNHTDGGEGASGVIRTAAQRRRAAEKARAISDETRAKRRASAMGRAYSPETLAKMSASAKARKRRPCSEQTKAKIAAGRIGNQWARGTRHTPEARANMSAAQQIAALTRKTTGRISEHKIRSVHELRQAGVKASDIANRLGISGASVHNIITGKHCSATR